MYTRLRCVGNLPLREDSVPETGFYGTEYACRAQKGFLGYATHFQRPSVLKTGFWGTEGIFGTGNALLRYAMHLQRPAEQPTPQTVDSLLPHRTHLQCAKRPPLSLFAPAAPSLAPSTALGARNDPRSDVSRHKKKEGDLSVYQDFLELPAAPVLLPPHAYIAASAPSSKKNKKRGCIPWKSLRIHPFFSSQ